MLIASHLTKKYGDFTAVKGVDFAIQEGAIFGFLGPNGAGKTTTINMLTGLARPTSGSVSLAGIDCVRNIKKAQQMMGIVPDESNLYEEMSGFDNLSFCASLYGMARPVREKRAGELLEQFGLADTGKMPFKAYSKGMKRKLTIAAGIIHNPKILFLDEPTTGIDVESARQIRKLIAGLNTQGMTVFMTTHYIEEAERLCSRIGFIVAGRIIKTGTAESLMAEVQQDHIVALTLEERGTPMDEGLAEAFPHLQIQAAGRDIIRVQSTEKINVTPLVGFFESRGVPIYEARIIRPSLEDVFVKITGIGISQMNREKEGGRKK